MDEESSQSNQSNSSSASDSTAHILFVYATADQVSDSTPSTVASTEKDASDAPVTDSRNEEPEPMASDSQSSEASDVSRVVSPVSADDDDEEDDVEEDVDEEEPGRMSQSPTFFDTSSTTNVDSSAMSVASGDDDASDVCSSIAESETADSAATAAGGGASKPTKRKRSRQPPIMSGYKKRRKAQHAAARKLDEENAGAAMAASTGGADGCGAEASADGDDKSETSRKSLEQSSSEENLFESSVASVRTARKYSSVANEVTGADKFCWMCHKEGGSILKCIACPRVYHTKCHFQPGVPEAANYDPSNFHCPECSAVLKADNVNTRSPVLVTVNLEQLCTLLKHIITILKSQKDSHYFYGPVDSKEFPDYREYVVYPMDISVLEKNIKHKVYGCTEAFLADVKWIVHNSIVFNSRASKITNIAKNLLKICKREILEIETCAECYYNSLVRKDTWFIEVCKRPHLLVWARLKGYPPWPAKALKCREGMVDCRFFGAHDKAWVPLKDCFLYSKVSPQPVKVKKSSNLENGIQELEKHIEKLQEKFGSFSYPAARIPYRPSQELEQLRMMLPNYNLTGTVRYVHVDRILKLQPKTLFGDGDEKCAKEEDESSADNEHKPWTDGEETNQSEGTEKTSDSPPRDSAADDSSFDSCSEAETAAAVTPPRPASKAPTPSSSPAKSACEPSTPPRQLVSVKNIDSINASVPRTPTASPTPAQAPDATDDAKEVGSKSPPAAPAAPSPITLSDVSTCSVSPSVDFDLSIVKDEPLETQEEAIVKAEPPATRTAPSILAPAAVQKVKRAFELMEEAQSAKKVKVDPKCRTVKITENVTLSLINQSPPEPPKARTAPKPRPTKAVPMAVPLVIPVTTVVVANTSTIAQPTSRLVYGNSPLNDIGALRSKVVTALPVNGSVVAASRPNTKVLPRVANNVLQTNGMLCVPTKPAVSVTPSRSSTVSDSFNDLFNSVMNESLAECHSQFRRIFESALDKLAGKSEPKGRLVALKKEMDVMKRNHDVFIDEMRRDYEVQIAELRATSVAKTQFDLAAERLKFEQEKERAVREAKSKQWCSNCQKIANYYCCWNTAYCDFECQKEHWIQHMHVCKNDVKKKTTESSENEPPRIMMQSEISNGHLTNGYDKTGSSFSYGNVGAAVPPSHSLPRNSNFSRPRTKVTSVVRSRPLTSRIAGTVSGTPSSNSSMNGVVLQSTYQNPRPAYSIGNNASVVYSPMYQK